MFTRLSKIVSIVLMSFLCLLTFSAAGYADEKDVSKTYEEKIKIMEEKIEKLEKQLQKYQADTTQKEDILYEQLMNEINELTSEIAGLKTTLESQLRETSRIRIWGENKLRLRDVTSKQTMPMGSYGEELERGLDLKYRLFLNLEARINDLLSVGGKLRLSNEGEEVFETGPEHFSNELGSAFIKFNRERIRATFGCYDVYFTPLTLMRWDLEDNPEGGGAGGCAACPGAGGVITSESLEELGPDLIVEGAKLNTMIGEHVDLVALFARPNTAKEDQFNPRYRRYTYGVRTRALFYYFPSRSFRSLGITYVLNNDDKSSVAQISDINPPLKNQIISLDFEFPILRSFALIGECALTETEDLETNAVDKGHALLGGMEIICPKRATTKIAYIRMSPGYKSLYNALSYTSNRQGFRISSNYEIYKNKLSVWIFYKRLHELEFFTRGKFSTTSLGVVFFPLRNVFIRSSYIYKKDKSPGEIEVIDNNTKVITAELTYDITRNNSLSLRYRRIVYRNKIQVPLNSSANVISTYFSTQF
jgi:hypothetical protein